MQIRNGPAKSRNRPSFDAWILATRPRTLPAAVAPVIVGSAMAAAHQSFVFSSALAALAVALLLQIGVNLANDYFDYRKGIDTDERLGPVRVTQSGLISPERVKAGMIITFGLAAVPGAYLIFIGGWPAALMGAAAILAALSYSGGPFPLGSHGFGDLLVFIFFGPVAVCGTYYVQTFYFKPFVLLMGVDVGLLITAILVVNNLRDIHTDRRAGKRTLAVIIGNRGTRIEYTFLLAGAYAIPVIIWLGNWVSHGALLPVVSAPKAFILARVIWQTSGGSGLNQTLAQTAKLALIFSLLLSIGLLLFQK